VLGEIYLDAIGASDAEGEPGDRVAQADLGASTR